MQTLVKNNYSVAKFGGTSVADHPAMTRCAGIVNDNPQVRTIVVSAPSGVTNLLVKLTSAKKSNEREQIISDIENKIYAIYEKINIVEGQLLYQEILVMFDELKQHAEQISLAFSLQLADEIIAYGERFSARLFTQVLKENNILAVYQDARSLIKTNSHFGKAQVLLAETKNQVTTLLLPLCHEQVVITEGFIGSTKAGDTTTLGRGGSDYSAAILAEALQAQSLYIWTDVPGIYTVDPNVVPFAKPLLNLSFIEAAELATFGAKVLHPATLWPAIREDIPVFVGSSINHQAQGTWVRSHYPDTAKIPALSAIALRKNQTLLTISSLEMLHAYGFLAKVFTILAKHQLSVDLVTTSEISVALTFNYADGGSHNHALLTDEVLEDLKSIGNISLNIDSGLCLIALVGNDLHLTPGISGRVFNLLQSFNVRLICHGASAHNLCFLVNESDAKAVVLTIHKAFFE